MIERELQEKGVMPGNSFKWGCLEAVRRYAAPEIVIVNKYSLAYSVEQSLKGIPLLVVATHSSNADGPLVYKTLRDHGFKEPVSIAGWKLQRNRISKYFSGAIPTIWVTPPGLEPKNKKEKEIFDGINKKAGVAARAAVRAGHPLVLFIESSRSRTGELQVPPAEVASYFYLDRNLLIQPLNLIGSRNLLQVRRGLPGRDKKVYVIASDPIVSADIRHAGRALGGDEAKRRMVDYVMIKMAENLPPEISGPYRQRVQEKYRTQQV